MGGGMGWEGAWGGGSCVGGEMLQLLDCKKIDCGVIVGWCAWGGEL